MFRDYLVTVHEVYFLFLFLKKTIFPFGNIFSSFQSCLLFNENFYYFTKNKHLNFILIILYFIYKIHNYTNIIISADNVDNNICLHLLRKSRRKKNNCRDNTK